jgi:hypothetical protein
MVAAESPNLATANRRGHEGGGVGQLHSLIRQNRISFNVPDGPSVYS